mmetsp:Transcript_40061/g.113308  ORF Transcript_40061/g.113308 Transcript_40061/m.113308 type:complete len:291 (-) Transcript_40061:368-1240(-)
MPVRTARASGHVRRGHAAGPAPELELRRLRAELEGPPGADLPACLEDEVEVVALPGLGPREGLAHPPQPGPGLPGVPVAGVRVDEGGVARLVRAQVHGQHLGEPRLRRLHAAGPRAGRDHAGEAVRVRAHGRREVVEDREQAFGLLHMPLPHGLANKFASLPLKRADLPPALLRLPPQRPNRAFAGGPLHRAREGGEPKSRLLDLPSLHEAADEVVVRAVAKLEQEHPPARGLQALQPLQRPLGEEQVPRVHRCHVLGGEDADLVVLLLLGLAGARLLLLLWDVVVPLIL